jgi:hypothetical protein
MPIGGVYQATVDAVDDGDVGRLRMTARRALVTAADFRSTVVTPGVLTAGSVEVDDVLCWQMQAGKFGSVDGVNYGAYSALIIPMAISGYRNCEIVFVNGSTSRDQAITVKISNGNGLSQFCSFILPIINDLTLAISSSGAVGLGGIAGGATAATQAFYSVPAMSGVSVVAVTMYSTPPTAGAFASFTINRWT